MILSPPIPFGTDLGCAYARMYGFRPVARTEHDALRFPLGAWIPRRPGSRERHRVLGYALGPGGEPSYVLARHDGRLALRRAAGANERYGASEERDPSLARRLVDAEGRPAWISGPAEASGLAIYFLHGWETPGPDLLLLPEAVERGLAVVHETGDVQSLLLEVCSNVTVLGLSGDLLKGGQQDRVLAVDVVAAPDAEPTEVPVYCVEANRWHPRAGDPTKHFAEAERSAPTDLKRKLVRGTSQVEVWEQVSHLQESLGASLGRGEALRDQRSLSSLRLALDDAELEARVDALCRDLLPLPEDAALPVLGHAVAVNGVLRQAELFATADLHRRSWPRLLRSAVLDALLAGAEEGASPPPVEAVARWVEDAFAGDRERREEPTPYGRRVRTRSRSVCALQTFQPEERLVHLLASAA